MWDYVDIKPFVAPQRAAQNQIIHFKLCHYSLSVKGKYFLVKFCLAMALVCLSDTVSNINLPVRAQRNCDAKFLLFTIHYQSRK